MAIKDDPIDAFAPDRSREMEQVISNRFASFQGTSMDDMLKEARSRLSTVDNSFLNEVIEAQSKWIETPPGKGGGNVPYSFRVYAETPSNEEKPHLYVDKGYRAAVDHNWEEVGLTDLGVINGSGVVYARRTYPKINPFGDVCSGGDGRWEEYGGKFFNYGNPPPTNTKGITIRVASVEYTSNASGVSISIFQEHFGNILVVDIADCQGDCLP